MEDRDELAALRAENARLVALLETHGIDWRAPATQSPPVERIGLSPEAKVELFRRLFRGRSDVYAVRWESRTTGKSGYAPACANEWRVGFCEKPRIKCADCGNRSFIPLAEAAIYRHLIGEQTVGVYPLQKAPREAGFTEFVDADLCPFPDQWAFLSSVTQMAASDIEPTILRATDGVHPLDVTFIDDEDLATPESCCSISAGAGQPPHPPGGLSEPRVLQGTGNAVVGLGRAARHWLC